MKKMRASLLQLVGRGAVSFVCGKRGRGKEGGKEDDTQMVLSVGKSDPGPSACLEVGHAR